MKYSHCYGSTDHFRGQIAATSDSATIVFGVSVTVPAFDPSIEHIVTDIETIPQSLAVKSDPKPCVLTHKNDAFPGEIVTKIGPYRLINTGNSWCFT